MSYNPKTDWQLNEIVMPADMNRIEQGIADLDSQLGLTVQTPVPANAVFTDTKVTAVGNHYTPSGGATTSASGGTLTDITNSSAGVQVVTGVTKDDAGHVTGVTSVALKSTNTNTTYPVATTTARIVSITSTAGLPGFIWKPKINTAIPIPPKSPRAIPPFLAP